VLKKIADHGPTNSGDPFYENDPGVIDVTIHRTNEYNTRQKNRGLEYVHLTLEQE
jgi:hypothetical protein